VIIYHVKGFRYKIGPGYYFYLLVPWTVLIALSVAFDLYSNHKETIEKSKLEARTIYEHNLAYRRWNAMQPGGVYAFITRENQPNPYIANPDRDLELKDGRRITMINPFRMTKQAYALMAQQFPGPTINRTVSLHPLNPDNYPDEWEKKGLRAFERDIKEVSEITTIRGEPYMRVMKPYMTVEGCLKCHGFQGYKVGDIRGGMSIAVPLAPYYASEKSTSRIIIFTHLLLWLMGSAGIILFSTLKQKQEKKISESESKFRTLSDFAQDWELWMKEGMEIVYVSPSCKTVTGYSQDEIMADPHLLCEMVHPDDKIVCNEHMEDFGAPQHDETEYRIITKDGQTKWLSHVCGPIYLDGKFLGRRISNRDITDRKRMEEKLAQSQKMESLGLLASGIVHDFNNYLTVIKGFASLLQEELKDNDEDTRKCIQNIVDSSDMAKNLTSGLLVFSHKQIVQPKVIILSEVISNISALLCRVIGEDIEVRIRYADVEYPVIADPHQIEQVLMNLITNAKDALAGGGILSIETSSALIDGELAGAQSVSAGRYMAFSVGDSGRGIDPQDMPRIFEPFFTTKEKSKGTGLGLSMVHEIVKQHGGFVSVYSEKKVGTTIKVCLPAAESEQTATLDSNVDEIEADVRGNETILVVEDEEGVRNLVQRVLTQHGYHVVLAADGEEALIKYDEYRGQIALLLLDVVLPKKNGKEVYDAVKAICPGMKAVFMSGYTQDILTSKGISEEGLEFIAKPLEINRLLLKMRSLIDSMKTART
jgi:PAS domain S-box-containing protein